MKPGYSCKLFGAHQALSGINKTVTLLHSVVGCNFGSMNFHVTANSMSDINQTCTVISDSEVVFGGEDHLKDALNYVKELYSPSAVFVVAGCISDIIQDDIVNVCLDFENETHIPAIAINGAGYRGSLNDGYEEALLSLKKFLGPKDKMMHRVPKINILGFGADDFRLRFDIEGFKSLLNGKAELNVITAQCEYEDLFRLQDADINLVLGRGIEFAKYMKESYGIPFEIIDYPYGLTGAEEVWNVLNKYFSIDFSCEKQEFIEFTAKESQRVYHYLQALYGLPVAVVGNTARANGLSRFLAEEVGFEIIEFAKREETRDIDLFYDQIRASETALIFGSSFEQDIADEMHCPLIRYDYPVFDRITLSSRPYIGKEGTLCLLEDILNESFVARTMKGALYQ